MAFASSTIPDADAKCPAPLVSIIVTNFNYAQYLRQCIDSALGQSHLQTEVIVVDDGSSDASAGIIRSYDNRVLAILQERNGGQAAALNAGFAASRGNLVIFLDADDYLYENAAARVASVWRPGVVTVQYRLHLVDAQGDIIDAHPPPELAFESGDVLPKLLDTGRYQGNVMSGNAFARDALRAALPIPAEQFRIAADGYLVTVAPFQGSIASIEEPLGAYRRHGRNIWMLGSVSLASWCRRSLLHDADKHQVLAMWAQSRGLALRPQPGLRDWQHLQARIGSLTLDPKRHPHPTDTRMGLAVRGATAMSHAPLPWRRRVVVAAWFLSLGVLPLCIARHSFQLFFDPSLRPRFSKPLFRALRRVTR